MSGDGEVVWDRMTVIQRVRYIHERFIENGERTSFEFRKDCALRMRMRGCQSRSDIVALTANDNYYQLAYRTGEVWALVERIFGMWERFEVKGQLDRDKDMVLSAWQHMQGLDHEDFLIAVLNRVVGKEMSLAEMGLEFDRLKVVVTVMQAFVTGLEEENWSGCKGMYREHATDKIVDGFVPLFKGWKDSSAKKKRPWNQALTSFPSFPEAFNAHIQKARQWRQAEERKLRKPTPVRGADEEEQFHTFVKPNRETTFFQIYNNDARNLHEFVNVKEYTLCVLDLPYGNPDCPHDDTAWSVDDIRCCVQSFKAVTTAEKWKIIVLHSVGQREAVKEVLKEECNGDIDDCMWFKTRNLKVNPPGALCHARFECFMIGSFNKDGRRSERRPEDDHGYAFNSDPVGSKYRHPIDGQPVNVYQKPRQLLNWMIRHFSKRGEWVLDLCSGSGTGLVSAVEMGRHCVAVELDIRQAGALVNRVRVKEVARNREIWNVPPLSTAPAPPKLSSQVVSPSRASTSWQDSDSGCSDPGEEWDSADEASESDESDEDDSDVEDNLGPASESGDDLRPVLESTSSLPGSESGDEIHAALESGDGPQSSPEGPQPHSEESDDDRPTRDREFRTRLLARYGSSETNDQPSVSSRSTYHSTISPAISIGSCDGGSANFHLGGG